MRSWIDLNSDMGESFGNYVLGRPDEVMKQINHANIACGFHAGDPAMAWTALDAAVRQGVRAGAHPSFPDRAEFGRRELARSEQQVYDALRQLRPDAFVTGDAVVDDELRERWFYSRAATIFGGASDVQRDIVAKRVLGLAGEGRRAR